MSIHSGYFYVRSNSPWKSGDKEMIKLMKLFRFMKPLRVPIVFVLVLTFLQAITQLFLPALMANIVDKGIVNGNISYILKIGGIMLLVAGGSVLFSILASFFSSRVSMGFGKILRTKVFTHVEKFSLRGFDKNWDFIADYKNDE